MLCFGIKVSKVVCDEGVRREGHGFLENRSGATVTGPRPGRLVLELISNKVRSRSRSLARAPPLPPSLPPRGTVMLFQVAVLETLTPSTRLAPPPHRNMYICTYIHAYLSRSTHVCKYTSRSLLSHHIHSPLHSVTYSNKTVLLLHSSCVCLEPPGALDSPLKFTVRIQLAFTRARVAE